MNKTDEDKKYEPYKIPGRKPFQESEAMQGMLQMNAGSGDQDSAGDEKPAGDENSPGGKRLLGDMFAEVEVSRGKTDASQKSQIIRPFDTQRTQGIKPVRDEKYMIFSKMWQIARENRSPYNSFSKFYQKQGQINISRIFYKQALFMKEFEDDFKGRAPFSSYFPYYQLMDYQQLRTYFTWRTNVRKGKISNDISLSYVFIYIYELLNNAGVNDPGDGLDKLMSFWHCFRAHTEKIDKYLIKWIKDYHIYYELPKSFKEFIYENDMHAHYPHILAYQSNCKDSFEFYCGISKYDIRKSAFYKDETCEMMHECLYFVNRKIRQLLKEADIEFDDLVFQPKKMKGEWIPFSGALVFKKQNQPDKRVVFSEKEIYIRSQDKWTCSSFIAADSGRQLVSYIMKQTESALRKVTKFKFKLSVNSKMINESFVRMLDAVGFSFEKIINDAVLEYYTEKNRTVISVNKTALDKIRKESIDTQEKLIVQAEFQAAVQPDIQADEPQLEVQPETGQERVEQGAMEAAQETIWTVFMESLSDPEREALKIILRNGDIRQFSITNGIMAEVLIDSINQKACDVIYDNIIDLDTGDRAMVYQEYVEELQKKIFE